MLIACISGVSTLMQLVMQLLRRSVEISQLWSTI